MGLFNNKPKDDVRLISIRKDSVKFDSINFDKKTTSRNNKKLKVSNKKFFKKPKSINLQRGSTKDAFFGDDDFNIVDD